MFVFPDCARESLQLLIRELTEIVSVPLHILPLLLGSVVRVLGESCDHHLHEVAHWT